MAVPVVGLNSYITVEEADEIVANEYISSDEKRKWWSDLTVEDKGVLLVKATSILNDDTMFGWVGVRVDPNQALAFPRNLKITGVVEWNYRMSCGLIELIFTLNKTKISDNAAMIADGISSFSDGGGLSIKFSENAMSHNNIISDYALIIRQYFGNVSQYIW